VLLVAKKEAFRRVEAKGAKFVEMSDLFAHKSLSIIVTTFVVGHPQEFPKNFPKLRKDFLSYWEHKVNQRIKNGGCVYQGPRPHDPIRVGTEVAPELSTAAHGRSCVHILLVPRKKNR
jgi:hypothetical protein